ncbi:hypothetical protein [Neisseria mucosa]|nr:hypothetical protein [Neisseria mucosa]
MPLSDDLILLGRTKGRLKAAYPTAAFCVSHILRRIARPNGASPR